MWVARPGVPAGIDRVERHGAARIGRLQPAQVGLSGSLSVLGVGAGDVAVPDFDDRVGDRRAARLRVHDIHRHRERNPRFAFGDVAAVEGRIVEHSGAVRIRALRFRTGVTAHAEEFGACRPDEVVLDGVGRRTNCTPATIATPAEPRTSSACRLVSFFMCSQLPDEYDAAIRAGSYGTAMVAT